MDVNSNGSAGTVPVGPVLSIFDPVFIGVDEHGEHTCISLIYRNMLIGGEPGGGKSSLLSTLIAHAALSADCRLCLIDGKEVELGLWADVADEFVGPDLDHAIRTLLRLQTMMNNRYTFLRQRQQRKISQGHNLTPVLVAIDELALFSATFGDKTQQETFVALLRDLVARGRAVGVIVIAATQRPSVDIIPTSLRDIFSWRFATRCTTEASSDIILGRGWAEKGHNAQHIAPESQGVGLLIAEGGTPRRVKAAYLTDADIIRVARYARWTRTHTTTDPTNSVPTNSVPAGAVSVAGHQLTPINRRRPSPHPVEVTP